MRALWIIVGLIAAAPAAAIDRPCTEGKTWDPNQAACVGLTTAPKMSPQQVYYRALKTLEHKTRARRAIPLLDTACKRGHGPACTQLGFVYKTGRHTPPNPKKSIAGYSRGCELGDSPGCLGAAEHHVTGLGGTTDFKQALGYYEAACKLDSGRGCYHAAEAKELGRGTKRDPSSAATLFGKAVGKLEIECKKEEGPSCYLLGLAIRAGRGTKRSEPRAFAIFARGCQAGSGDSCFQKGVSQRDGIGTKPNRAGAMTTFRDACDRYDSGDSCFAAGQLLAAGEHSPDEKTLLKQLGERACQLDQKHCLLLARLLDTGAVGKSSATKAIELAATACDHGNGLACFDIAIRMLEGPERWRDTDTGIARLRRSCDLSYGLACEQLAIYHDTGEYLSRDLRRAQQLRAQACTLGYGPSCTEGGNMALLGRGFGGTPNLSKALSYFRYGCAIGEGEACVDAAQMYADGTGVKASPADAEKFYSRACLKEYAAGCVAMGRLQLQDKRPRARLAARLWFKSACLAGAEEPCAWMVGLADAESRAEISEALQRACSQTDRNEAACLVLAKELTKPGGLTDLDERRAFRLLAPACEKRNYHPACIMLSDLYRAGIGTLRDPTRAEALLTDLCRKDVPRACTKLGHTLWFNGSYAAALPLYRRACADGDAGACNNFAFAHYTGFGAPWNLSVSIHYWTLACEKGSATGCTNLGEAFEHGIGVAVDLAKATAHYLDTCTLTKTSGCGNLGRLQLSGTTGVRKDPKAAVAALKRACESSSLPDSQACRLLVEHLRPRAKSPAEQAQLARWAQRAYELAKEEVDSNPHAAYLLGTYHRDGFAAVRDRERALSLFAEACDRYDPLACMAAGDMYQAGPSADPQRATVYYQRACAARLPTACEKEQLARKSVSSVPLEAPKGPKGCACRAASSSGGRLSLLLALASVLVGLRRRGRRRPHGRKQL